MGISITTDKDKTLDQLKDTKLQDLITALEGVFVKPADLETKAVAEKVLGAKENNKSILVDKLGTFLSDTDATNKVYGTSSDQSAKDYLAEKYPFVKTTDLETKAVAEKVLGAKENNKSILVDKLGTFLSDTDATNKVYGTSSDQSAKDYLAEKYPFVKTTDLETKAVAEKVLGAKDGNKSILVDKLGTFLDEIGEDKKAYNDKVAKDFLAAKGLIPDTKDVAAKLLTNANKAQLVEEVANNKGLQNAVATHIGLHDALVQDTTLRDFVKDNLKLDVSSKDTTFQGAVRNVMSETHYDMPSNQNEPLSWHIPFSDSLLG